MKDSTREGVTLRRKAHTPALAHAHTKGRIIPLATWKQEAAGRMPGSTTWRQRSSTSEGGVCGGGWCSSGIQHADGSRLWGGEGDVCVCVRGNRWIYLSLRAMYAPSMPQFRSLQLISLTSGLTLEAEADISLVLLISAARRAPGASGRPRFTQSAQEGGRSTWDTKRSSPGRIDAVM